jgi:two-component sensor histidine kinase
MPTPPPAPLALELALAVVTASAAPLLLLDGDMRILAASDSFHAGFDLPPADSVGQQVFALDGGAWNLLRLRSALAASSTATTPVDAYEFDLPSRAHGTRRLILSARRLAYTEHTDPRILVSIADVTDARLAERRKEELIRERDVLILEVQHRVANSLQIIASVLMQSARKVQSEEVRRHLHDAHHRVMSIASVQDQLAVSGVSAVSLRPYLTQLCTSIGASMIEDHDQLALTVRTDNVAVPANISVSLGLIVTELVINALKHAFPGNGPGTIHVDYTADRSDWALTVADNGIGMPLAPNLAESGLGSSIVQALARQLKATILVRDNSPGTCVEVTHTEPAADGSGPREMPDTPAI